MSDVAVGASWDRPDDMSAESFDTGFRALSRSGLETELAEIAYGDDLPVEVEPYGMTTWWTLGQLVANARLRPGGHLVDLACGRGGPGLWLARATAATLVGVDWSVAGVEEATRRAPSFVPAGRARFVVGDLAATGLPDESADVVMCMDAVFFAPDRVAALREAFRVLRPGGRYLFTASERACSEVARHAVPDWEPLLGAAGLDLEVRLEIPRFAEQLRKMYEVWLTNLDRIRAELGDQAASSMQNEAQTVGPVLQEGQGKFFVAYRP